MNDLVPTIGLEIHAQLATRSKMFCACRTDFGAPPNSQLCPVCAGLPGSLPVVNRAAVEMALLFGLATGAGIREWSRFARKSYFYPDLPKGYQITQYELPICEGGTIPVGGPEDTVDIALQRAHLEEDTGKSIHAADGSATLVDLNRSGVPLLEIVTAPVIRSPAAARGTLEAMKTLLEYLGICDGNMEEGSLRCDANVSVAPAGEPPGTRTEIKNLNSMRSLERSLAAEIERQRALLAGGGRIVQETLLWDEKRQSVAAMRRKEESHDYRYFPDPDLPPLHVTADMIAAARAKLPETPARRAARFRESYRLPSYDAWLLTTGRALADYYEAVVAAGANPKAASNLVMGDVLRTANERAVAPDAIGVTPGALAELAALLEESVISSKLAKDVFQAMVTSGEMPRAIVAREGWTQVSDADQLTKVVIETIDAHPAAVQEYRSGKARALQFLVGMAMKASAGKANPEMLNRMLRDALDGKNSASP